MNDEELFDSLFGDLFKNSPTSEEVERRKWTEEEHRRKKSF